MLKPCSSLAGRPELQIGRNEYFIADLINEIHELLRTEGIRLDDIAPEVDRQNAFGSWTDAVTPIVGVGKAATWPAHNRYLQCAKRLHNICANPADVRDLGVFADPLVAVDPLPQMFGELYE